MIREVPAIAYRAMHHSLPVTTVARKAVSSRCCLRHARGGPSLPHILAVRVMRVKFERFIMYWSYQYVAAPSTQI